MNQKLLCLMDCFCGNGLRGTKISTSWDSSTKEGTACFHSCLMDVGVGTGCNIRMLPSFRVCTLHPLPFCTTARHWTNNNPKIWQPCAAPCWEMVHLERKHLWASDAMLLFFVFFFIFLTIRKQQTNKDGCCGNQGISWWGVRMALAVGCCKHPTESPRTKHQLPVKDVYSSPNCQQGWRPLLCWWTLHIHAKHQSECRVSI